MQIIHSVCSLRLGRALSVLVISAALAACNSSSDGGDSSTTTPGKPTPPTETAVIHCAP